ncbi:MAG TPA: HEAT repeat domain-containing protein [Silvibacterium sp.]|nr:HEAT repeat domain-containing protein [Silvibacterium sp.]
MKTNSLLLATLLGATLCAPLAFCAESPLAAISDNSATKSKEDALYSDGTRAINDGRWADAEAIFAKIAQPHGERAEAALYWQAYAENKQGKSARALETCAELRQAYPHGSWVNECGALEIEIRGKNGDPPPPQAEQDEDLKLLALNSLMQQDDSRALPIIQQILEGDHSERLKDRALFVLAQDQSQQAQAVLGQIARGQKDPALQRKAIQMIAVAHGPQSAAMLADIYRQSTNEQVKKAIIQAYLVTGNPNPLVEAASHESNPQLVKSAVQTLGAMGATSQLLTLYRQTSNAQTKAEIINAFVAAGQKGADALGTIASSEQDPELRRKAIRNLGIAGGMSAAPSLVATYKKNSDPETKKAVIQALFLAGDSHDLVELARAEKDPSLKQAIVQQLSIMHSKEATDYMLELLNK